MKKMCKRKRLGAVIEILSLAIAFVLIFGVIPAYGTAAAFGDLTEPVDEENENYLAVEDEAILDAVYGIFKERYKDVLEFAD